MKTRQQLLIETHTLRQQATELASLLEQSHRELTDQLTAEQRQDIMKAVAGRSAIERALHETRRMIEALDRALEETRALEPADRVSPQLPAPSLPSKLASAAPDAGDHENADKRGAGADGSDSSDAESPGAYAAVIARIGLSPSHPVSGLRSATR